MPNFRAGLIAIVVIGLCAYFGFTKTNPFSSPETVTAVFSNASGLKPKSPVRIAGVEMGTVKEVKGLPGGTGTAEVTMEVKDNALPLHTDAEAKIRTRIFLEGNFFVDIKPGTPSAPILPKGEPIPMNQTYSPVQLGDVLRVLKSDIRADLRTLLAEFSLKGLGGGGAEAFNDTIDHMEPAYKSTAVVNDALLGENPTRDLQRVLKGQQRVAAALTVNPEALQGLVTNVNTTAGALAREDVSLAASIPALRDLLKTGSPALASLNGALPSLRRFAVEALPGVRSTPRTIDAAMPFLRQTRKLFTPSRAARLHAPDAHADPAPGQAQRDAAAAARRGARALLVRQRRAAALRRDARSPRPSPATPARRSAASSTAASSASPARAAPTTPTRRGSGSAPCRPPCSPRRARSSSRSRPMTPTRRRSTGPTCRARLSSRPTSTRPARPGGTLDPLNRTRSTERESPAQALARALPRVRRVQEARREGEEGRPARSGRRAAGEAGRSASTSARSWP